MDRELREKAREARRKAYAPYSNFLVGAALRTKEGLIFTGANVENASYPLGCCAERVAIYTAVAAGYREFERMVIVGEGPGPLAPCGGCRQVMREFGDFEVVLASAGEDTPTFTHQVSELLPLSFTKEDLG